MRIGLRILLVLWVEYLVISSAKLTELPLLKIMLAFVTISAGIKAKKLPPRVVNGPSLLDLYNASCSAA